MALLVPVAIVIAFFIVAPTFVVVMMSFSVSRSLAFPPPGLSFGHYGQFFHSATWLDATANSVIIAAASTLLTLLVVTPAAFGLNRFAFAGKGFASLLLMTPLMVPHIALALGYYAMFGPMQLIGTHIAVILAHTALNIPVAFLIISAALTGFDRNLERAAANLGASPLFAFFTVTLPVLATAFIVASLFSFIHSFDETTIALFISGFHAKTLPRQMFESIQYDMNAQIAVASTLLTGIALVVLLVSAVLREKLERQRVLEQRPR